MLSNTSCGLDLVRYCHFQLLSSVHVWAYQENTLITTAAELGICKKETETIMAIIKKIIDRNRLTAKILEL